jgi:hypothetical protein
VRRRRPLKLLCPRIECVADACSAGRSFSNVPCFQALEHNGFEATQRLQTEAPWRPPRLQFTHTTPAVLRFQNGRRVRGKLQVISVTGGVLNLSSPLDQGSRVKLMFLTDAGAVLGTAEMLPSVSGTLQPFRFVTIDEDHERRLRDIIQSSVDQNRREQRSIVKDRAW